MNEQRAESDNRLSAGTTSWKIKFENYDLHRLKQVAERIAVQNGGMIPKPSVTALIQQAVKHYIADALQDYPDGFPRLAQR